MDTRYVCSGGCKFTCTTHAAMVKHLHTHEDPNNPDEWERVLKALQERRRQDQVRKVSDRTGDLAIGALRGHA